MGLGQQQVTFTHWDPFILGDVDDLAIEIMTAQEAAQRELKRWRAGRFDSVQLAVADAVFSKQQDYRSAARTSIRPFAAAFRSMTLYAFCGLEPGELFRRIFWIFGRDPSPGKEQADLSPEGRIRTICEVSRLLLGAGVQTIKGARGPRRHIARSRTPAPPQARLRLRASDAPEPADERRGADSQAKTFT